MRKIEFRAKGLYKNRWYYGNYVEHKRAMQSYIIDLDEENMSTDHFVDKNTLCQFTGIKDKNNKKIYDGDIVYYPLEKMYGLVEFLYGGWYITWYGYVQVSNGISWEEAYMACNEDSLYSECLTEEDKIPYEIVGNKFDNPELLTHQHEDKGE